MSTMKKLSPFDFLNSINMSKKDLMAAMHKKMEGMHKKDLMAAYGSMNSGMHEQTDEDEIAEAAWYKATDLPYVPPQTSLSGQLISSFVEDHS